jgi:hypothetical protein
MAGFLSKGSFMTVRQQIQRGLPYQFTSGPRAVGDVARFDVKVATPTLGVPDDDAPIVATFLTTAEVHPERGLVWVHSLTEAQTAALAFETVYIADGRREGPTGTLQMEPFLMLPSRTVTKRILDV